MTHISAMEQEIATQQKQLYNAYIRIKELNEEVNYLKKQIPENPVGAHAHSRPNN